MVTNLKSDLSEYRVDRAQRIHEDYCRNSGAGDSYLKLSWKSKGANRLRVLLTDNKMSPYAAIQTARPKNLDINFSERSLYNYIHHYNYPIESSQLPLKNKRKKASRKVLIGWFTTMTGAKVLKSAR